jgi:hypothetical protein
LLVIIVEIFRCLLLKGNDLSLIVLKIIEIDFICNSYFRFSLHIQEKDEMELRPVFTDEGITYVYIKVDFECSRD